MPLDKKFSPSDNGIFRPRKVNFAQVSNLALRDKKLSLRARGLYSIISSYITIPGYILAKSFVKGLCTEGNKTFQTAWDELKDNGYLKQYRIRDKGSNNFRYEYELLDEPDISTPGLANVGLDGLITSYCAPRKKKKGRSASKTTTPENSTPPAEQKNKGKGEKASPHVDDPLKSREEYGQLIKKNISYDILKQDKTIASKVDSLFSIILDVVCSKRTTIRANKENLQQQIVKERFLSLTDQHIRYVCECLERTSTSINISAQNYIITALYNSPATIDTYYSQKAKHDLKEWEETE